jgi:viologen exporter family transport system permease protein
MRIDVSAAKYAALARVAAGRAYMDRAELYGRMLFFPVILGVFSSLWHATRDSGMAVGGRPEILVWYLAATEWILLSAPLVHVDIQEAVRRGDVIYDLGRPISYVGAVYAQSLGLLAARAPILGATAVVSAFLFTGSVPPFGALALVAVFGLAASGLLTALHLVIGLLAFWMEDVSPVYWIWQKALFVLGGLMLPIGLYPALMQRVAALTPFPLILAGPASFVLEDGAVAPATLGRDLVLWSAATMVAAEWLFRRATNRLSINGG